MTNSHAPGTWYLAPSDDLTNEYSAGYDGNSFATREEAETAIEGLGEAFGDDTEWVAVQRRPDVAAYLAEIVAVGKRYGLSLSHEDGHGAFIVEGWSRRLDQHVLVAQTAEDLLRKGLVWPAPAVSGRLTVYIVSAGEYEDRTIRAIFSTRDLAEKCAAILGGDAVVEEWEVDECAGRVRRGLAPE